jgi:hypothetical protein
VSPEGDFRNAGEMDEKTLSFEELRHRLLAKVSHPVSVQVVGAREIVAFLEGPIDGVMGFESPESHGSSFTAPPVHGRCSWPSPSSCPRPWLRFPTASSWNSR